VRPQPVAPGIPRLAHHFLPETASHASFVYPARPGLRVVGRQRIFDGRVVPGIPPLRGPRGLSSRDKARSQLIFTEPTRESKAVERTALRVVSCPQAVSYGFLMILPAPPVDNSSNGRRQPEERRWALTQ